MTSFQKYFQNPGVGMENKFEYSSPTMIIIVTIIFIAAAAIIII